MMRGNGYTIRRIGTIYLFERNAAEPPLRNRLATWGILGLKYLYHAYVPWMRPLVQVLARLSLIRRI